MIRRKVESKVTGPSDGVEIYSGTGTSYVDTGLSTGTTYHYRAFAMNDQDEPQTAECVTSKKLIVFSWNKYHVNVSYMRGESTSVDIFRESYTLQCSVSPGGTIIYSRVDDYTPSINGLHKTYPYIYYNNIWYKYRTVYVSDGDYDIRGYIMNESLSKGLFIEIMYDENQTAYPMDGEQDGYWYVSIG